MQRIRGVALLQVALFSCAMLTAWSHRAHERHGYCSAHGALIHLQGEQTPHNSPFSGSSIMQSRHVHGVHDCAALTFLASGVSAPEHVEIQQPLGLTGAAAQPPGAPRAPAIPMLLQAPKASPPAA